MAIICCGISHKTAPLEVRERFQIPPGECSTATESYKEISGADEAVVVVSCNRVEFYSVHNHKADPYIHIADFYRSRGVTLTEADIRLFYVHNGSDAVRHLFKVASGLDSTILGESQILTQVKTAYGAACACGSPGPLLHKLFHKAFQTSKLVRSETSLNDGVTGLAGAAVEMARLKLEGGDDRRAVIIGVNSSTEIILSRLSRIASTITLINRTPARAGRLAQTFGCKTGELEILPEALSTCDILFSATSAKEFVVTPDMFTPHNGKPLLIFDLAIPRDVDPQFAAFPGVTLVDLDGIKQYLEEKCRERSVDLHYAEQLVEEQVVLFDSWVLSASGTPSALRKIVEEDRRAILEKSRGSFAAKEYKALEAFSRQLCRQLIRRVTTTSNPPIVAEDD